MSTRLHGIPFRVLAPQNRRDSSSSWVYFICLVLRLGLGAVPLKLTWLPSHLPQQCRHLAQQTVQLPLFLDGRPRVAPVLVPSMLLAGQALAAVQATAAVRHCRLFASAARARFCAAKHSWYGVSASFHVTPSPGPRCRQSPARPRSH